VKELLQIRFTAALSFSIKVIYWTAYQIISVVAIYEKNTGKRLLTFQKRVMYGAEQDEMHRTQRFVIIPSSTDDKPQT